VIFKKTHKGCSEPPKNAPDLPNKNRETIILTGLFLAAFFDLMVRNAYHGLATETTYFFYLIIIAALVLPIGYFSCLAHESKNIILAACRLATVSTWIWLVPGRGYDIEVLFASPFAWLKLAPFFILGISVWLVSSERRWRNASPAILFGILLSLGTQILFSKIYSPNIAWPSSRTIKFSSNIQASSADKVAFVLLDELNARDKNILVDVLKHSGMSVVARDIIPVANSTAEVIPQIWSGRVFPKPRACSSTAICSDKEVLDFSKIHASRSDIDVIGFYHPYCSMQGLRSCVRTEIPFSFNINRWLCSIEWRINNYYSSSCLSQVVEPWLQMRSEMIGKLFDLPFWSSGGLLYAHLPLPHPPGSRVGGTLRQHYNENIVTAAKLLREIANRMRPPPGGRARLIVFSDHPLRIEIHCSSVLYRDANCKSNSGPQETHVPLIVASIGGGSPEFSEITKNSEIFSLAEIQ
jgi:hypothetical protein